MVLSSSSLPIDEGEGDAAEGICNGCCEGRTEGCSGRAFKALEGLSVELGDDDTNDTKPNTDGSADGDNEGIVCSM